MKREERKNFFKTFVPQTWESKVVHNVLLETFCQVCSRTHKFGCLKICSRWKKNNRITARTQTKKRPDGGGRKLVIVEIEEKLLKWIHERA